MAERIAGNAKIQGSAAEILKLAMIEVKSRFIREKIKTPLVLTVHDELVFELSPEEFEHAENIVNDFMEKIIELDVPLKINMDTVDNWVLAH